MKVTGHYLSLTLTLTHKVKVSRLRLIIVNLALSVFSRFVTELRLVKSFKVSEHLRLVNVILRVIDDENNVKASPLRLLDTVTLAQLKVSLTL